ncbi:hypothetical protein N7495_008439 [Penicillium taxi]|uniref:uncharacterized protein n=1 Tax=Penicillium taxi TaxID=168475 RepID=UPI002545B365|nr:uncharacterized protein N7495_008439 [Penicillium taxi]KAJ5888398.1 hypothetical protein N7495_008439 [Penicillium taxi]
MTTVDAVRIFDVGAGQVQGARPYQEDRYTVLQPEEFPAQTHDKIGFFAVYDGHGTGSVSEHASKNLHFLFAQRPEFNKGDYASAIKAAISDEDRVLFKQFMKESEESGSTVAVCIINFTEGELIVSNLGDSHVILAERDPKTEQPFHIRRVTEAHKPEIPSERKRIEEAGGEVVVRRGIPRIGCLNMSRALGDLQYKNFNIVSTSEDGPTTSSTWGNFISNEPYTSRRTLKKDRRYILVIASDGVTDRFEETDIIHHVIELTQQGKRASDVAECLVNRCGNHIRSDNASCIIMMIDGQES